MKNLQEDALQALLPIVQPAAEVRSDLDVGESCGMTMPLQARRLGLKLRTLVMRRDPGIANGLARWGMCCARRGSQHIRLIAPMAT